MKNDDLKRVIKQIKKYNLSSEFESEEEVKLWLLSLNSKQIHNFLSLNININDVLFPLSILVDLNMLNCDDYIKRINALLSIKNGDGCWHLFEKLLERDFIYSSNYYEDIELLKKADTARYALIVMGCKDFINSPYHTEDLKLIVETRDVDDEKQLDFIVSDALSTVASNIKSINSPYHRQDMKLIAESGSGCLQMSNTYPESSINNLAVDEISLTDPYHLENMQILAKKPISSQFLYLIMIDPNVIKGQYYREEVDALVKAKSINTARALYYYIVNPDRKYGCDIEFLSDCSVDCHIDSRNAIVGNKTPNYLNNLSLLNSIPDKFIMYYLSLIMNGNLIGTQNIDRDLETLRNTSDSGIFMDLYNFILNDASESNTNHSSDIDLLSNTTNPETRKLLLRKMTDKNSYENQYREFDLNYISNLKLDNIDSVIFYQMQEYLFTPTGINASDHVESLIKLSQGKYVEPSNVVLDYLNNIEKDLTDSQEDYNFDKDKKTTDKKCSRLLMKLKKYGKK